MECGGEMIGRFILGAVLANGIAHAAPPQVAVEGGTVEGREQSEALTFQGIPFAAPPIEIGRASGRERVLVAG